MQTIFYTLLLLIFTQNLLAQKDCDDKMYQVVDAGWISQSIRLNATPHQEYSIRLVSSVKGLTATITAKNNLTSVSEGDYWIFISKEGQKQAFQFLDKTRPVTMEGQEYSVNTIALNWEGLEWLSRNKVVSFGAMDASLKMSLIAEINMTKIGAKSFDNISKCFFASIDPRLINNIEIKPLNNDALSQVDLEKKAMNNNNIQFNEIDLNAQNSPERYSGIEQPEYAKSLSRLAELYQAANNPEKAEQYYL